MKNIIRRFVIGLLAASGSTIVLAQDDQAESGSPFKVGPYLAPMASGLLSQTARLDKGYGGVLHGGYRMDTYAFEISGIYSRIGSDGQNVRELGGSLNALWFPISTLSNTFLIAEFGGVEVKNYPQTGGANELTSIVTYAAGAGQLLKLNIGNYEFGIRAELLYRYGERDTDERPSSDPDVAKTFKDVLFNVGLQLPLSAKSPPPPPPPAEPVEVVAVEAAADSDGDGVPDDRDRCPGTAAGTAVDDVGCALPPPCKPPESGAPIQLSGCAVGDSVVLRGVNFDFNKASLTVNAKTILDSVVEALIAAPSIEFSIEGHTDAVGSDAYNQTLSEARAQSAMEYLEAHGVAPERMRAQGFGESRPVADNDTDEGRELNRRVELKITAALKTDQAVAPISDSQSAIETPLAESRYADESVAAESIFESEGDAVVSTLEPSTEMALTAQE